MKHLSRFLLLVVLLISVPAHARTGAAVHKDVLKAAKGAVAVYRAQGLSGLIGTTQRCYDQSHNQGLKGEARHTGACDRCSSLPKEGQTTHPEERSL